MRQLLQIVGILIVLLIVLRVSMRLKGKSFGLRARVTGLNIATGALIGLALASFIGDAAGPGASDFVDPAADAGYNILANALRSILPFSGAAFGGLAGYLLLGTIWQWLSRSDSTTAQAWLRSIQIAICAACLVVLGSRLL